MTSTSREKQSNAGANQGGGKDPEHKTDSRSAEPRPHGKLLGDPQDPPSDPPPKTDSREEKPQRGRPGIAADPGSQSGGGTGSKTETGRTAKVAVRRRAAAKPEPDPHDPEPKAGRVGEVKRRQ